MLKKINRFLLLDAGVFIVWLVLVLLFVNFDHAVMYVWTGVFFTLLALVVSCISVYMLEQRYTHVNAELSFLPVYYAEVYYGIVMVVNTLFIFFVRFGYNRVLIVLNLIALVAYVGIFLFVEGYVGSVSEKTVYVEQKVSQTKMISAQLALVITSCSDADVRKKLMRMKEQVDMGQGLASQSTELVENEFLDCLKQLQNMLDQNVDKESLLKKVDEAERLWKKRTVFSSNIR